MRLAILLVLVVIATRSFAHPLDLGLIQLETRENEVSATLDLNPAIAAKLLDLDEKNLNVAAVQSRAEALRGATLASGSLTRGGQRCEWKRAETELKPQLVRLRAAAECESGATGDFTWSLPFVGVSKIPETFQVMIRARGGDGERVLLVEKGKDTVTLGGSTAPGFGRFLAMGIEHIGAAPNQWHDDKGFHLPDGIDHILFVLALVLAGGGWMSLLATASGFTVGHSITLALGAFDLVHVPSRIVESAIALSIAVVAAEAFFKKGQKHRWQVATLFGLVHGLGFATAISELHLSHASLVKALVGFNVGVELGQAILIAVFVPIFIALARYPKARAVEVCSALVFLMGTYWFIQRALGL